MNRRFLFAFLLAGYAAILIKVVVFKDIEITTPWLVLKFRNDYAIGQANLIPFRTIRFYLRGGWGPLDSIFNLGGNIFPFVPLGFLVPLVYRKMTWPTALAVAAGVGLAIEGMEVIFRVGIFDIDDVILNAVGVAIGYWIFRLSPRGRIIVISLGALVTAIALVALLPSGNRHGPAMGPPGRPPGLSP